MLSIFYGFLSALSWGAGDFAGGLASRRLGAYRAVLYADFFGLVLIAIAMSIFRESIPNSTVLINSIIGGALGSMGLLILYYSLAQGQMSIAAPVSALFAAVLPVIVGALTQGLPDLLQLAGFGLALTAVWLISQGNQTGGFRIQHLTDLRLPILAGVGFGSYFIFIHYATQGTDSVLWPMLVSRLAGTLLLFIVVLVRREPLAVPRSAWTVVFFNATLDVGGNLFYILASQLGRLDTAAVLSSLYPGATVLLAWILLKERIAFKQWVGIASALAAIVLFTL
ncbi:MAG TPA: EamA family transporter [Anaerolineales bacterium]|nr:EamA family transporter [Anaerolineales bacterium]